MSEYRLHIFGASGSGTSTLGREVADRLSIQFFGADDYYWQQTDPPYALKNTPEVRVHMLLADMKKAKNWVLSGSVVSWGDMFIPLFTAAIFVTLPHDIRLQRLRQREQQRYGHRIADGGDMHEASKAFLNWATLYDTAGKDTRSLVMHEAWIERLECPVIRVQSLNAAGKVADEVMRRVVY